MRRVLALTGSGGGAGESGNASGGRAYDHARGADEMRSFRATAERLLIAPE